MTTNPMSEKSPCAEDAPPEIIIRPASVRDVDELLRLYYMVYNGAYPLVLGTDRKVMTSVITGGNDLWLVAQDKARDCIVGSAVVEIDRGERIGKLAAVVSHPGYRKCGIAAELVRSVTEQALCSSLINSVYTTTRTISMGPQLMCLNAGYIPLGIFPNAHRIKQYETVTLMARYRDGVLERRVGVEAISTKIAPLWSMVNGHLGSVHTPEIVPPDVFAAPGAEFEFEIIEAQSFIARRFDDFREVSQACFYPFHAPNALLVSTDGVVEIFAYLSRQDRYCTLVATNVPFMVLHHRMDNLLEVLKDHKAEYIETLVPVSDHESIAAMLDDDFLPSAVYPAMRELGGRMLDYIVMSRTMVPLDLRGMQIAESFKPYIDQYIELWKQMHIDALQVFSEHRKAGGSSDS